MTHPDSVGTTDQRERPLSRPESGWLGAGIPDPAQRPTLEIPEAGRLFGMSRASSYEAAKRGYLPTIQIGERRKVVPTAAVLRMLGIGEPQHTSAA